MIKVHLEDILQLARKSRGDGNMWFTIYSVKNNENCMMLGNTKTIVTTRIIYGKQIILTQIYILLFTIYHMGQV